MRRNCRLQQLNILLAAFKYKACEFTRASSKMLHTNVQPYFKDPAQGVGNVELFGACNVNFKRQRTLVAFSSRRSPTHTTEMIFLHLIKAKSLEEINDN